MKHSASILLLLGLALAGAMGAARAELAPVVSVTTGADHSLALDRQCWAELTTEGAHFKEERERIRAETPWYVPYIVPAAGTALGALVGNQYGQADGKTAMTWAGGLFGFLFGPGAVVGALFAGQIVHDVAQTLGASDHLSIELGVAAAIGGAIMGKPLFDQMIAGISPYYADKMKDEPEKPNQLKQVRRCGEHAVARHTLGAFRVVYRYDEHERVANLPFDPGEWVAVGTDGAVDLSGYDHGVLRR